MTLFERLTAKAKEKPQRLVLPESLEPRTLHGDQGYLFLFIDFNDPDKPLIHIRTWQPERNPELTPNLPPDHPRAGIFSPACF